jgi:hypothetical protein
MSTAPQPNILNKVVIVDAENRISFLLNGDPTAVPNGEALPKLLGQGWRIQSVTGQGQGGLYLVALAQGPLN